MSRVRDSVIGFPIGGRETLLDSVARRMIQLLMDGHYKAGEQLPSEYELARQFKVGRGTIREAIKALAIVGFVRAERGKGTFVADRSEFLVGPISLGFESSANLESLVDTRKLMEVHIAQLAAKRADRKALANLESHLVVMERAAAAGSLDEYLKADMAFHFAIADAARNQLLSQFLMLIRNLMRQWVSVSLRIDGVAQEALTQHREIAEAIRKGDEELAGHAMSRHLDAMGKHLLSARKDPRRNSTSQYLDPA
jgi:GntR family transcriptional regulator, transcriptional repressor for pyruvate dehydrogenase complex